MADPSLFVLAANNSEKIILLRHVDDMLITGTSSTQMELFLNRLKYEFAMIDLGQLHYFLGVKIDTMDSGLFLSRQRYATNLLLKAGLQDCKPISTPTAIKSHPPDDSPAFRDPTLYLPLVGSVSYLTFARPDICCTAIFLIKQIT